jgi:predicted ribosome quality control (RQC) complex YloA/Tae2 family protein
MELKLNPKKSIEENATIQYDVSKKARKRLEGLKKAIDISQKKVQKLETFQAREKKVYKLPPVDKWYMKFRWFTSSEGFLCIGGRDATTNDIVIKKYAEKGDLIFHTEHPGSPFFIIKAEGKEIPQKTKEETAQATLSFSKAWKEGLLTGEVYSIGPDQVKKEFGLPKGSFMIHGKREYYKPVIGLYIGVNEEGYLECGPVEKAWSLEPEGKRSDCAKWIKQKIIEKTEVKFELDYIIRILPGDCKVKEK